MASSLIAVFTIAKIKKGGGLRQTSHPQVGLFTHEGRRSATTTKRDKAFCQWGSGGRLMASERRHFNLEFRGRGAGLLRSEPLTTPSVLLFRPASFNASRVNV